MYSGITCCYNIILHVGSILANSTNISDLRAFTVRMLSPPKKPTVGIIAFTKNCMQIVLLLLICQIYML